MNARTRQQRLFRLNTSKSGFLHNIYKHRYAYTLILPAVAFVFVFAYLPFPGIIIAFQKYDIINGVFGSPWVGFDNFKTIFLGETMLRAIGNSFLYGGINLVLGFPFPIILAILFNEIRNVRFKKTVQTIVYMPHFLSWISVVGLFYTMLSIDGALNGLLAQIFGEGFVRKNILMDSNYFLPIIFLSYLWKSIGWSSVIYLAAISGIDPTLYEAASIDGCGKLRQAWHITVPGMFPTIVIVLVMSLGTFFNVNFEQVFGFQNVYTQEATEVISTVIYRQGIQNGKYSLATAFGLAQGLVSIVLLLGANACAKKIFSISIW